MLISCDLGSGLIGAGVLRDMAEIHHEKEFLAWDILTYREAEVVTATSGKLQLCGWSGSRPARRFQTVRM